MRESSKTNIGMRISTTRKERGLTQVELAKKVGIKQPSLSELEKGETKAPKGATLIAIAAALNLNPSWLMTGRGPKYADDGALSSDIVELAERISALPPEKQELLLQIFSKDGVSDGEVEEKMPVTTQLIKTQNYEGPDRRKPEEILGEPITGIRTGKKAGKKKARGNE